MYYSGHRVPVYEESFKWFLIIYTPPIFVYDWLIATLGLSNLFSKSFQLT
jgi:hypothetical protein